MPVTGYPIATNNNPNPSNGTGFNYGGELDATPQSTQQIPVFDRFQECAVVGNVLTPNGTGAAYAQNIVAFGDSVDIKFVWPELSPSTSFVLGFFSPPELGIETFTQTETDAAGVLFGTFGLSVVDATKTGINSAFNPAPNTANPVIGDEVLLSLSISNKVVTVHNITQNQQYMLADLSSHPRFSFPLSLFYYGNTNIAFEITSTIANQFLTALNIPSHPDGKTYLVTAATENSVINGQLVKADDFVTFFNEGMDCVVTRLVSDDDIRIIAEDVANTVIHTQLATDGSGSIYNAIQAFVIESISGTTGHAEIQTAIETGIDNYATSIGVGGNNQPYLTVQESAEAVITNNVQSGGIIDNAIQAAINP